jgi:hypothetical protein
MDAGADLSLRCLRWSEHGFGSRHLFYQLSIHTKKRKPRLRFLCFQTTYRSAVHFFLHKFCCGIYIDEVRGICVLKPSGKDTVGALFSFIWLQSYSQLPAAEIVC